MDDQTTEQSAVGQARELATELATEDKLQELKKTHNRYPIVTPDGRLLDCMTKVEINDKQFKQSLPKNTEINCWKSRDGQGYQQITYTDTQIISAASGTDPSVVKEKTYRRPLYTDIPTI